MYQGKHKCETLKAIRKKIADANEIPYEPVVCTHQGDCMGTCPACESEMRYIEDQLNIRKMAGKVVKIVGLATAMTLAACNSVDLSIDSNNNVIENAETPFVPVEDEVYAEKGFFDELVHAECPKENESILASSRYPMSAVYAGVVGTIYVSFIVEEDGSISNVTAKESVYPDLTKEAVRVVQNMEKWKPAMLNGTPVRSKFHVPILFRYDTPGFCIPPKECDHVNINIPEDEDLYFVRVEKNAEYPEGKMALFEYLKQNLDHIKISSSSEKEIFHYDQINDLICNRVWTGDTLNPNRPLDGHKIYDEYNTPIDTGAFHEIPVEFIVEKSGFLSNVKVYESDSSIHDEILRVVKKMPKWKPATIRDTVVRSRYILPVLFKIDN